MNVTPTEFMETIYWFGLPVELYYVYFGLLRTLEPSLTDACN